mmetsp:Transcript_19393/g.20160  ORF Transcript_19393/g.20160 Transcript_19393/m.20160 type:complete len:249 (+) Transcript_19393:13-759(+)
MEETKKIIEEVQIKRKENTKSKEVLSQKIKTSLLNKKRKKLEMESYFTAQKLLKNNRENQKSFDFYKKQASINNITDSFFDQSRVNSPVLVIRIQGTKERISKPILAILREFKLLKICSAVIVDYNKENYEKLTLISSYVTWGFTNKKVVSSMVTKRGLVFENQNLQELSNTDIEAALGKQNILCIEDLIYELYSVNSKKRGVAMGYLGFFLLSPCEELKENAVLPFHKGGCTGYRGDSINELAVKMI